jgi:uncharacterized membrane protein (DUF485 family)
MEHKTQPKPQDSPYYQQLLREKKRLLVPLTLFFFVSYFSLPILTAYYPQWMSFAVWGRISFAWVLAFAQFAMVAVVASIYVWRARHMDQWVRREAASLWSKKKDGGGPS